MGGVGVLEGMCALHAVIVLWFWCWGTSLMIQPQVPEYSRPLQLSLFRTVGGKPMCDVVMDDDVSFSFWC
jgi:hypothetical protein